MTDAFCSAGETTLMPRSRSLRIPTLALAAALALAAGAARAASEPPLPPASHLLWAPTDAERLPAFTPAPPAVEPQIAPGTKVSLGEVLDLALRNSPRTRATWLAARAAAAEMEVQRAEYYPTLDLSGAWARARSEPLGGKGFEYLRTTYGPSAALSFLLFDFGGRSADLGEARFALLAADWIHNAEIQAVILEVEQTYYTYLGASATREAVLESIREAESNLSAAEERRAAGVATIADVLQARTLLDQERFALAQIDGSLMSIKGALATAIGVRPDIEVELPQLPADLPLDATSATVSELLDSALAERPDLAAARAAALAARERIRQERSDGLPTLGLSATGSRTQVPDDGGPAADNYQLQLSLRVPLFDGFERRNRVARATAEAEAREALVEQLAQQVQLQVWTAYYDLETEAKQVIAGRSLLDSASQSASVAEARYRAGAGNILDLLAAQRALATARALEVQSRASWFRALAQLRHDIGRLDPPVAAADDDASRGNS